MVSILIHLIHLKVPSAASYGATAVYLINYNTIHNMKEFHSPTLRRTVKPNEKDYLKHYKDALLFELNYMNKQKCSCMGCHDKRKTIEKDLKVIFNIDANSLISNK